jgi:hypothetical protein
MADDFWAPVFERLLEDYSFLELVAADTSENDLVSWVKPNRALFARCARFIKKNRVLDKPSLVREMLVYARTDPALRKIILFTWVEKNSQTMKFPTLATDADSEMQLQSGAFGNPAKIRILAQIDPRAGAKPIYERVLASFAAPDTEMPAAPAPVAAAASGEDTAGTQRLAARVAELEKLLENFRADNRQLKKQYEQFHAEIVAQNRRIENYSRRLKESEQTNQALEQEAATLRRRVAQAEEQLAKVSVTAESRPAADNSEQLAALSSEVEALRRALDNRAATIRRLESEKAEIAARYAVEADKDRQIEFLRWRLSELEPMSQSGARLAGQLVSTHKEPDGRRSWLFMSISGQVIFVEGALVSRTSLVREEFAILQLDSDNRPVALESLETDARREICGCVEVSGGDLFLVADSQRYQVMVEVAEGSIGRPVRGVWLPEFAERKAGIYRVEALAQHDRAATLQKTADARQLRAFFRVARLNLERFVELLKRHDIDFKRTAEGELTFLADYHEVLEPMRMHVKIYRSCDNVFCQNLAAGEAMVRPAGAGQSCDFCGQLVTVENPAAAAVFAGQRVKIFGGDYVGSEYERALAQHNLNIEWHSGFKNLSELKAGLGRPDLVVIIVRQISHTLLRELVAAVARESLPVLYSSRRGISGILAELTDHFNARPPV